MGPACVLADGAGPVALAGKELFDGIDGLEVLRLPLGGGELVGAVVGGALIDAPRLVQLVALAGRHSPQPVNPDFVVVLHADKRTKNYAERYAELMLSAMLRNMTTTAEATVFVTDLSIPEYAGPGIGMSAGCGVCFQQFDLMYEPVQYPTLPNDMGEPEELICDACQDAMEADREARD